MDNSTLYTTEHTTSGGTGKAWDDATWILTSSFIIFTMQSGFGLLESGIASRKNEVNIMVKNAVDVVFGGLSFWMLGYGFSFGTDPGTNSFCGIGSFFLDPEPEKMGEEFSQFIFQASFATTATTIVSGAIAERTKLSAYVVFSFFNTFIYCFPAHWVWAENGWMRRLEVVDFAGDGPVHLVGGVTSFVAAWMIKPRHQRFTPEDRHEMGMPTNVILGMFILWWGWLGFNCGSTFGISGGKWKIAARAAANTILASCGGGIAAMLLSYVTKKRKFDVGFLINGILGALVSITGICAVTAPWEATLIGVIGGLIGAKGEVVLVKMKIDDPVAAVAIHGFCAVWGLLACGLFTRRDTVDNTFSTRDGLLWGGGFYLLGVQIMAVVVITVWTLITSFILLKVIDLTIGLRLSLEEEILGADIVEHNIYPPKMAVIIANKQDIQLKECLSSNNQIRPLSGQDVRAKPGSRWALKGDKVIGNSQHKNSTHNRRSSTRSVSSTAENAGEITTVMPLSAKDLLDNN
ncbi:putative ammonium transporter 3 [Liolophura sinensis]|uniref:putative ammonium transporter 3 n=1 Tax=Liolophura sinensis TaxID=3198878 RepID=UPI003158227D